MTRSISPTSMSIILGLVAAVGPFAIDMYLPAMPDIGRDLGASQHEVQWTIVGYFITFGLAQLVQLWLSALTGNRQPTLALVLPALVSALLWPWISFGLRGLRRRYKIN